MTKHKTWQDLLPEATAVVQEWHTRPPTNVEMSEFIRKRKQEPKYMKISDIFPSKWLRHEDLSGREVKVVIDHITMEQIKEGEEDKPVIYFVGKDKGLVLNKTNAMRLASTFGDTVENWSAKEVVLYAEVVNFPKPGDKGLRIRVPQAEAVADDEIPF